MNDNSFYELLRLNLSLAVPLFLGLYFIKVVITVIIIKKLLGLKNLKELYTELTRIRKAYRMMIHNSNYNTCDKLCLVKRFIEIYNSRDLWREGQNYRNYCSLPLKYHRIDEWLEKLGLFKIDRQNNRVRPIKNWANTLLYGQCKLYFTVRNMRRV